MGRLRGGQAIIWPSGRGLKELSTWTRPSLDPAKRYFVLFKILKSFSGYVLRMRARRVCVGILCALSSSRFI